MKGEIAKDQIIKQVSSTLFLIILFPFELFGKKHAISRFPLLSSEEINEKFKKTGYFLRIAKILIILAV